MNEKFSRRELFQKFTPDIDKIGGENDPARPESTIKIDTPFGQHEMSRRDFTKLLVRATAAANIGIGLSLIYKEKKEASEQKQKEDLDHADNQAEANEKTSEAGSDTQKIPDAGEISSKTQPEEPEQEKQIDRMFDVGKDSYSETAFKSGLMIVAKRIAGTVFRKFEIPHGNKSINPEELNEKLNNEPIEMIITSAISAPMAEEFLFRLLPSDMIRKAGGKGMHWEVGIPMAAIFAGVHNLENKKGDPLIPSGFNLKSVPITQFMGGLFYWYLMRERGYSHATLAHSLNNSVWIGRMLLDAFPEKAVNEGSKTESP